MECRCPSCCIHKQSCTCTYPCRRAKYPHIRACICVTCTIHVQIIELAHLINPGLEVITCGSYRYGKPTCGNVDILVTHSDGRSNRGVLPRLVQEGKESGEIATRLLYTHWRVECMASPVPVQTTAADNLLGSATLRVSNR